MDPRANLQGQRENARRVMEIWDSVEDGDGPSEEAEVELAEIALEQAQLFQALDQWLTNGGFSPWA